MSGYLTEISVKLAQILLPITMVVGVIGNSLNILTLSRPNLRNNACSRYFLALSSNNLIYSICIIYYLLSNGYSMDGRTVSVVSCKILLYIGTISPFLSPYFIVLASIDRYFVSSSNARIRRFSNVIVAKWSISIFVICSLIFYINTLVLGDVYSGPRCTIRGSTLYSKIFLLASVILSAGVPPCLMAIFGSLTIYNISGRRLLPQGEMRHRRTEGQLIRMLLVQVGTYMVLNVPLCIIYLILALPTGYVPTVEMYFAYSVTLFPFHFSFATTFFLYILSARIYREELTELISQICGIRRGQRQINPVSATNQVRAITHSNQRMASARP